MNFLKAGMHKLPEYMQLRQAVESNALPAVATGLSGIHKATIINALVQDTNKTALLLAADGSGSTKNLSGLNLYGIAFFYLSTRDFTFRNVESASREYEHQRIQVLSRILKHDCDVVVACMDAALQYTIPPNEFGRTYDRIKERSNRQFGASGTILGSDVVTYVRNKLTVPVSLQYGEAFWISSLLMHRIPFELNSGATKLIQ